MSLLAASGELVVVLALGLLATLPIGAVLGSVFTSARAQGLSQLPIFGLMGISRSR